MIDPHTAIGLHAARGPTLPADVPVVTLATAHPAKFRDAVERATGTRPPCPRASAICSRARKPLRTAGRLRCGDALHPRPREPARLMADTSEQPVLMVGEGLGLMRCSIAGDGRKLERYGHYRFIRPNRRRCGRRGSIDWDAHGEFVPGSDEDGGGRWHSRAAVPEEGWPLAWDEARFTAQCTPFRHLGFFPDMAPVWDWMRGNWRDARRRDAEPVRLYRRRHAGAEPTAGAVTHVDASKKSVAQARDNAALSGMEDRPIRWLVDDAANSPRAKSGASGAMTASSSTRPNSGAARRTRSGGSKRVCPLWSGLPQAARRRQPLPVPDRLCRADEQPRAADTAPGNLCRTARNDRARRSGGARSGAGGASSRPLSSRAGPIRARGDRT